MDLGAHVGLAQGTAGSIYQVIYFTNLGNAPCTMYGYPGVSLAAGSRTVNQVGAAASRSTATAATVVTLDAGQSANATAPDRRGGELPDGDVQADRDHVPADLPARPDHADLPGLQVDRVRVVVGQPALGQRDDVGDRRLTSPFAVWLAAGAELVEDGVEFADPLAGNVTRSPARRSSFRG